jgi:fumarate hydratase subunit beta
MKNPRGRKQAAPHFKIIHGGFCMNTFTLDTSELKAAIPDIHAGDTVILSGTAYTSRDAAHKRIMALLDAGKEPPYPIENAVVYYAGPTPAKPGQAIGSVGPTTSGRMDPFAPRLLELGLAAMIGKGERSPAVVEAIQKYHGIYLCAIGGAGALYSRCITKAEEIAFHDLGCESVKRLTLKDFKVIAAIDMHGGNLFITGRKTYAVV